MTTPVVPVAGVSAPWSMPQAAASINAAATEAANTDIAAVNAFLLFTFSSIKNLFVGTALAASGVLL